MTEKPIVSYWHMQAGQAVKANPPFPKYKMSLIHWSLTNGFKLIFLTSENGMGLQQTDNDFSKLMGGKETL